MTATILNKILFQRRGFPFSFSTTQNVFLTQNDAAGHIGVLFSSFQNTSVIILLYKPEEVTESLDTIPCFLSI